MTEYPTFEDDPAVREAPAWQGSAPLDRDSPGEPEPGLDQVIERARIGLPRRLRYHGIPWLDRPGNEWAVPLVMSLRAILLIAGVPSVLLIALPLLGFSAAYQAAAWQVCGPFSVCVALPLIVALAIDGTQRHRRARRLRG